MIAQWYCPSFWLTMLPTTSETSSATECAMLAISATTQQFTSTSTEMTKLVVQRGDTYYGRACSKLLPGSPVTVEEALNTSLVLLCYDWGFGRQSQSLIHANAAVKMYQSLETGHVTSRRSELSKYSRELVLEVCRAFFYDMHFPVENFEFLKMLERRAQLETKTAFPTMDDTGHTTVHWPSARFNPFVELATPLQINAFFWLIIVADSKQALHVIQEALDQGAYQHIHDALPRSREQEIFNNEIYLYQLFCRMHLVDIQYQDAKGNDDRMSEILDLIQINKQLTSNKTAIPLQDTHCPGLGQQGLHCYLGLLGFIGQRAYDPGIRLRAFSQITFHGTPNFTAL